MFESADLFLPDIFYHFIAYKFITYPGIGNDLILCVGVFKMFSKSLINIFSFNYKIKNSNPYFMILEL